MRLTLGTAHHTVDRFASLKFRLRIRLACFFMQRMKKVGHYANVFAAIGWTWRAEKLYDDLSHHRVSLSKAAHIAHDLVYEMKG